MRSLALVGLFISSITNAANTTLEAFDFKRCQRWTIESGDIDVESQAYKKALQLEKTQPNSLSNSRQIQMSTPELERLARVFSASTFEDKEQLNFVQKFGVCTYKTSERSVQFNCLPNQDFPFSGATYAREIEETVLPTMKCVSGCNSTQPPIIYDTNMNEGESDASRKREQIYKQFQRQCGKGQ